MRAYEVRLPHLGCKFVLACELASMALPIGLDAWEGDDVRDLRCRALASGERGGVLDEETFQRRLGEDAGDGLRGCAVAVGVFHAAQSGAEVRGECAMEGFEDEGGVGWGVEDVLR